MEAGARLRVVTVLAVLLPAAGAAVGCNTGGGSMNRELKREADRSTILLNRARSDLESARADADKARAEAAAASGRVEALNRDVADLRTRLARTDAELLAARQRIRQLEEAALAAGVTVPPAPR